MKNDALDLHTASLLKLYYACLSQSSPGKLVQNSFRIKSQLIVADDFSLPIPDRVDVLAFGKASLSMYRGVRGKIGKRHLGRSLVITHLNDQAIDDFSEREEILFSTHPDVSSASFIAGRKSVEFVSSKVSSDLLLVLVSGGGSAMVAMPADGISPETKMKFISAAIRNGVPEREVNSLRKALSQIKGGQLAERARARQIVNLILSDEREHDVSAISSGLTVYNEIIDPITVMDQYALWDLASPEVSNRLLAHGRKERIADGLPIFNLLVGTRDNLVRALIENAPSYHYNSVKYLYNLHSISPESAADRLWNEFCDYRDSVGPGLHLIVATGEVQVKVNPKRNGLGGRNQHLAALMMRKARSLPETFCFLAIATDGVDFLDGVHGAFFNSTIMPKVLERQDEIAREIENTNTYALHHRLNSLVPGGKTGSNFSDFFLFSFVKS